MIAELERRTRAHFEDDTSTHLDYVCAWVESGKTMLALSKELAAAAGYADMLPGMLGRYLRAEWGADVTPKLANARTIGAHGLVDEAMEISDEGVEAAPDAARARNRIAARQWAGERWGREDYGTKPAGGAHVTLNLGFLHLSALRARARASTMPEDEGAAHLLSPATESATAVVEVQAVQDA